MACIDGTGSSDQPAEPGVAIYARPSLHRAALLVPAHGQRRQPAAHSPAADAGPAEQVSAAVNPANEGSQSFQECVLIRHPRHGEFAFGFITGSTSLQARAHPALLPWMVGEALSLGAA